MHYLCRGVRPFGVSLLIAGWDEHRGSTLYQVDPSGSFWPWKASAIGKNMVNAKTFLEKRQVFLFFFFFNYLLPQIDSIQLELYKLTIGKC
jgi:hypothetical protein